MKISSKYIKGFFDRNVVPANAWSMKIINNQECYVIKNSIYCNVFWVDFWYHFFAEKFKNQKMIVHIQKQDLTLRVTLSENLELLSLPVSLQNIAYAESYKVTDTPYRINISINTIFLFCILIYAVIIAITFIFFQKSKYSMFV